jgi:ribonuclease P protein subunit RPR2
MSNNTPNSTICETDNSTPNSVPSKTNGTRFNPRTAKKRAIKAGDNVSRVSYLFQAAEKVAKICPALNQHYGKIMTVISEKTAAKRDFTMKRSMCKKCNVVLVLGVNASYRLRRKKNRKSHPTQVITCQSCKTVKRFPTTPGYKLGAETNGVIESH